MLVNCTFAKIREIEYSNVMPHQLRAYKASVFQALAHPTRIAIVEILRDGELSARPGGCRLCGPGPDCGEGVGHGPAEEVDKAGDVGFGPSEVVVVRGADGQRLVVGREVAGVVLVEGVDALEPVAGAVQHEGGKGPGGAAVPVVVGVDRRILAVGDRRDDRDGQFASAELPGDPREQVRHESGDVRGGSE